MIEAWSTAALLGAVIEALLEEPAALQRALAAIGGPNPAKPAGRLSN
jgi:hypothetical protein